MVFALTCAAGFSGAAFAAAPPGNAPAENTGLEEIVVTAEKRDSTVQATPISMTALSAADLQQQNIATVEDLVGKVPGISLRTAGPGQTEYEMRGLSAGGGTAATVGFYIDETPLSASAVALNGRTVIDPDLFDLNHVEAAARTAGHPVRFGLDGRHDQARHQSAQAGRNSRRRPTPPFPRPATAAPTAAAA